MRTNAKLSVGSLHNQHSDVASHEVAMLIKLADDGPKAAGAIESQEAKLRPRLQKVPMASIRASRCHLPSYRGLAWQGCSCSNQYLYVKME